MTDCKAMKEKGSDSTDVQTDTSVVFAAGAVATCVSVGRPFQPTTPEATNE